MTKRACALFAPVLLLGATSAQITDSSTVMEPRRSAFRVIVNFDARRTEVAGEQAKFYGFRIGAQRDRDIVAVGFYGLSDPFIEHDVLLPGISDTTDAWLGIDYAGISYERILYDSKHWQFSVPVQIGLGNVHVDYVDTAEVLRPYSRQEVTPLEVGVRGAYKLFFWLHLTAGTGYRQVFTSDDRARDIYSDFTWNFGLSLKLGEIVRYTKRKIKEKKDG